MSDKNKIKLIDKAISNKKIFKRILILIGVIFIAGTIAGLILFTPFEYKDKRKGREFKKGTVLEDYKN